MNVISLLKKHNKLRSISYDLSILESYKNPSTRVLTNPTKDQIWDLMDQDHPKLIPNYPKDIVFVAVNDIQFKTKPTHTLYVAHDFFFSHDSVWQSRRIKHGKFIQVIQGIARLTGDKILVKLISARIVKGDFIWLKKLFTFSTEDNDTLKIWKHDQGLPTKE